MSNKRYRHEVYVNGELKQYWIDDKPDASKSNYQNKKTQHELISREVKEDIYTDEIEALNLLPREVYSLMEKLKDQEENTSKIAKLQEELKELKDIVLSINKRSDEYSEEKPYVSQSINTLGEYTLKNTKAIEELASKLDSEDVTNLDTNYEATVMANFN